MMKKFRLLSLVLALLMILTMFAGCGNKDNDGGKTDTGKGEQVENAYNELPEGLKAEKIGSIDLDDISTNGDGGIYYKDENGKYGIMTLDGKKDTGAKYTSCEPLENYFQVMTVDTNSITDAASLNCIGVVDATGKEIVPLKYASIKVLNERYIRVCEVTEQTTNKDEALVYYTDKMFSLSAGDGDTLFKGNWYVYDVTTGKTLEGVTGTQAYQISVFGNFVQYVTDAEEQVTVNDKGEKLPEDADLFDNGYYALVKDNAGAVYDSNNKKVFDYALDGFVPTDSEGDYILAAQYGDTRKYVLMDLTGKVVSGEFTDMPTVYGDLIHAGDKVYDLKGNVVVEGTFKNVYFDEQLGNAWFLKNDKDYTLIKKGGTVLYQGTEDDTLVFDAYSNFSIKKKVDDKNMYYSLAEKDFTLEGSSLAPWLVQVTKPNYIYDIADAISGKTIISGYQDYAYVAVPGSMIYVYAQKADGGIDIYTVK